MAMISDIDYLLQSIRLTTLRACDDPSSSRVITLDPAISLNPYVDTASLSDLDQWPEIKLALDSPPLEPDGFPDDRRWRRRHSSGFAGVGRDVSTSSAPGEQEGGGAKGLNYTQTIMGGKKGGAGMRVSGRADRGRRPSTGEGREGSTFRRKDLSPGTTERTPTQGPPTTDAFFSPSGRPRADSAPMPNALVPPAMELGDGTGEVGITKHVGASGLPAGAGFLGRPPSTSEGSEAFDEDPLVGETYDAVLSPGLEMSARPGLRGPDTGAMGEEALDEGSDVDEAEFEEDTAGLDEQTRLELERRRTDAQISTARRSMDEVDEDEEMDFTIIPITANERKESALTAALNKYIPHLVSTSSAPGAAAVANPFSALYASVAAASNTAPITLQLYFPHSSTPSKPIEVRLRKDVTVEEVTGFGLLRYWDEAREPRLSDEESEQRWSTIGWGLRIVEDDGEVDDDFPPLDRDGRIVKFASYGAFAVVEATAAQMRQNAIKAPHVSRRPSRVITGPSQSKLTAQGAPGQDQGKLPPNLSSTSLSSSEQPPAPAIPSSALKGSVGLSSALSMTVLLRVKITASADVHFTTTISVPSDMYIADLTEVLCARKRLQGPASNWVLCLDDLSLALPLDRTVASLEGRTNLALVRKQWAVEHGLRIGDRRGGDPSASIFKRISEPAAAAKFGNADFAQTYKKYHVHRKIAIGRHERILAIDGDYIHIMPSESRSAFFDSMKTTSFHISLMASCKLSGRSGGFKIVVWRDAAQKRYEFEADTPKQAAEIITTIRALMKSYQAERSSAHPPPPMATTSRR